MIPLLIPALLLTIGMTLAHQDSAAPSQSAKPQDKQTAKKPRKHRSGGFLGLYIRDAVSNGQTYVHIDSVVKGSDAEKLGFKKGDRILRINRRRITNGDTFIMSLWGTSRIAARRRGGRMNRGNTTAKNKILIQRGNKEIVIEAGYDDLDKTPAVGQTAPDFTLKASDGKTIHALSKIIGDKPVVLIFGSWT